MSTEKLVAQARARFNHAESKQYLKEKYTNMLTVPYAGGMFKIDRTLLTFLSTTTSEILIDIYDNPIKVDRVEFLKSATATYNSVMTRWLEEHTQLSKNR